MSKKSSLAPTLKTQKVIRLVPPDGGWGWMVLIGTAISNIFNQSMLSLFSLLYGDALEAMGHNTSGAAIVMSTMLFVANFGGPLAGALVKLSSTRTVAVSGAISCTLGIFFSGFATNIWHLVITYGILLGLGLGFIQNSSFVAINSYFKLKKSRAVGLANVGTGVGQTLMPHLVRYLLEHYGFRGACLMLSSLSLHGICGTMLLQPVEWHMKKIQEAVVVDENLQLLQDNRKDKVKVKDPLANGNDAKTIDRRATEPDIIIRDEKDLHWNEMKSQSHKDLNNVIINKDVIVNGYRGNAPAPTKNKSFLKKLYELFDISLLSSPRFINIIIGTAMAVTSIQNFSMIFPLFLQKSALLDKKQTAICMSAVAGADIAGRLILPIFQDKYRIKARWMLIMTCTWLIVIRQVLVYQTNLNALIVVSCLYGMGRSMIIVARNIAIAEHCKKDQVPAAVGLGMLTMGIFVPPVGYFLGWIRDHTGSYVICITAQNLLLLFLLVTWIPDMILMMMQERRRKKKAFELEHTS